MPTIFYSQPTVVSGAVSIGSDLETASAGVFDAIQVTGNYVVPATSSTSDNTSPATLDYATNILRVVPGSGLSLGGNVLSVNASQISTDKSITTVGMLNSLRVGTGSLNLTNTTISTGTGSGALIVGSGLGCTGLSTMGNATIGTGVLSGAATLTGTPSANANWVTKQYIDDRNAVNGSGLLKTGTVLSLNPTQTTITSIGDATTGLTSLTCSAVVNVANTTASSSTGTGAVQVTGGVRCSQVVCGDLSYANSMYSEGNVITCPDKVNVSNTTATIFGPTSAYCETDVGIAKQLYVKRFSLANNLYSAVPTYGLELGQIALQRNGGGWNNKIGNRNGDKLHISSGSGASGAIDFVDDVGEYFEWRKYSTRSSMADTVVCSFGGSLRNGTSGLTYTCGTLANRWAQIYATNGTVNTSDARLKKDVVGLSGKVALDTVSRIDPFTFEWIRPSPLDGGSLTNVGVSAQEVQEAVSSSGALTDETPFGGIETGDDGKLHMDYNQMIAFLVGSLSYLDELCSNLEGKI